MHIQVFGCLRVRDPAILDQPHRFKLELSRKPSPLHDSPPVPSKHLTRCLRNRVQANRGDVIRKGDEVFVHWSIDGNGLLNAELELPSISKRYSFGQMYVSTRDHRNFNGDDGIRL